MTDFGKAIRILRIESDRKMKQDAEELGVTASYISAIEHGKKPVSDKYLEYCIKTYGNKERLTELAEKQNQSTYVFKDVDNGLDLVCRAINKVKDDEWPCVKDMLLDMVVVRCKDCIYHERKEVMTGVGVEFDECAFLERRVVPDVDNCCWGERKEE